MTTCYHGESKNNAYLCSVFMRNTLTNLFHLKLILMLKDQLISKSVGCIIDVVRSERGRLSFVSDEAQVNRQYFNRRMFRALRFFQVIRVLYVLAIRMDREDFMHVGQDMFAEIWDFADDYEFTLLDEGKQR